MRKYMFLMLAALLASGCERSALQTSGGGELPEGEMVGVALSLPIEGSHAISRATATTSSWSGDGFEAQITTAPMTGSVSKALDDSQIANYWILQFDGLASDSKLIFTKYIEEPYVTDSEVILRKSATPNRVAVVANTFDADWAAGFTFGVATWQQVSEASRAVAKSNDLLCSSQGAEYLPMSGTIEPVRLVLGTVLKIPLIRTVAKVVVKLRSGEDLNATTLDVQMRNVPNATSWFPSTSGAVWPVSPTLTSYPSEKVTGVTTTGYIERTFWLPVNRRGGVWDATRFSRASKAPAGATYLSVLAGAWVYRVHLGANFNADYNLNPNTIYTYSLTFLADPADEDSRVKQYVEIDGLGWAVGNLVASSENSCKIGSPTDNGLYFQFGSLIGWTGGANGDGVGSGSPALDKAVWPWDMSETKPAFTWQSNDAEGVGTLSRYYFNYSIAPWNADDKASHIGTFAETVVGESSSRGDLHSGRYANLGVGDPCSYYLGGSWRLPTSAEWLALLGADGANTNKGNPLKVTGSDLSFRVAGYRSGGSGAISTGGLYWSGSVASADRGYSLYFVNVNSQYRDVRSNGMPVRCVTDLRRIGYVTRADDGTGLPAGMKCVGMYGGHDGTKYTKALYIDNITVPAAYGVMGITYGANDQYNGLNNMEKLTSESCLAANYCRSKGMYLPAIRQLKDGVYAMTVGVLSNELGSGEYRSSTELNANSAMCVSFPNGNEISYYKRDGRQVRCVAEF